MSKKTKQEQIEEFIRNNKIQKIPTVMPKSMISVGKAKVQVVDLMSIGEAADMYGEKQKRKVKKKNPDMSKINKDLIPESLHGIINLYNKKEENE